MLEPIDEDIRSASTPPGRAYRDDEVFARVKERVFARSWQLALDTDRVKVPGQCAPFTLLPGVLDEPLLATRDAKDELSVISNVCTHRGTLVCEGDAVQSALRCRYHGRRFALDGRFLSMPEFDGAKDFPRPEDSLPRVPFETLGKLLFVSLDPAIPFADLTREVVSRISFLPLGDAVLDPSRSRDYLVNASWALYCDNYLEGFHIPYVHPALASALEYGSYRTELFAHASLQVGIGKTDEDVFDPPAGHPDHGQRIAGYYFWLFPNTMLNVYPWGISVNVVKPLAVDRTKVSYLSYVWDASKLDRGAGSSLDRVEREDVSIVESVQRGVRGRLYRSGRYSPSRETGVHHFHRLLTQALANG